MFAVIGCYLDNSTRDLASILIFSSSNTLEYCTDYCYNSVSTLSLMLTFALDR